LSALAWYGSCYLEIQALSLPKKCDSIKQIINCTDESCIINVVTQCCQILKQLPIRIP
jgi:hypothetical protein